MAVARRGQIQTDDYGLAVGRNMSLGQPEALLPHHSHVHSDIELNFVFSGNLTYFIAGRHREVSKNGLAVFWAGIPHQVSAVAAGTDYAWVSVPLAWFVQWALPKHLVKRLMAGDLLADPNRDTAEEDRLTFQRWAGGSATNQAKEISWHQRLDSMAAEGQILLLEVEARLHRLALALPQTTRATRNEETGLGGLIEDVARFVSEHYAEPITVTSIAEAVGRHPAYVSPAFKRACGMRLWDYVQRLRISHAQRLLATTDLNVLEVAISSGFMSDSRFYDVFRRTVGLSPGRYRSTIRQS